MALWSALFSRPSRPALQARPSLTLFFCLVGSFLLTLVPHIVQLPLWLSVTVIAAMVIRSIMEVYRLPLPSKMFCNLLALCLLTGIFFQFKTIVGRDAGMAFIAGLLVIKFYELRGPRDIALILFSGFFVVMSALLYSQALELFIYCLIMMWVLTALLLRIQIGDLPEDQLLQMLRGAGVIFLQALPLTIFLFFFFPRYTGKLQVSLGESPLGFTDTIKPGDIAALSNNDSEAMYVRFLSGDVPAVDTMYWRGLVLWHYQNGTWTAGMLAAVPLPEAERPSPAPDSNLIVQEITILPHNQKWLFALDSPVKPAIPISESPPWSTTLNGNILQLSGVNDKLDHKERYTVTSSSTLTDQVLTPMEKGFGIQLPGDNPMDNPKDRIDPEVRALADRLRLENPDDQAYVRSVLHYFRHEGFTYSATPGIQNKGDWLHAFLFTTKTGFCEHFAAAFAVLMRLEKLPARLVVGYQGAQYNPYDASYIIKQSNAHAWDEVWIDAKNQPAAGGETGHWQRVDPTAILAASENAPLPSNDSQTGQDDGDLSIQVSHHRLTLVSGANLPHWMRRGLEEIQFRREQVEANWDDWVFSYNPETQNRLAQALGFGQDFRFMLGLTCLVAVGISVAVFQKWIRRKPPLSPVENFYAVFCRNMAQHGVPRAVWEGPLAYTGRVAEAFPDQKKAIEDVGWIVAHSRYGPSPIEPSAPKELQSLLTSITASEAASSSREHHGPG